MNKLLDGNFLDPESIMLSVNKFGFCTVKKVFSLSNHMNSLIELRQQATDKNFASKISASSESPIGFLHKFNIGGSDPLIGKFPRCFETIYIPQDVEGFFSFPNIFAPMINLRNSLMGKSENYVRGVDFSEGLWTACRLQHYFRGGGFFGGHTDVIIDQINSTAKLRTVQLVGVLSNRGEHFETGGAFIETSSGRIDLDDELEVGDVVIYDGASFHGVHDIDANHEFTTDSRFGRWSALVSLYQLPKNYGL
jgi:hypothetical protein